MLNIRNRNNKMPNTLTISHGDQNNSPNSGHYGHLVKAQLPNQQKTTVNTATGFTIREALAKALKLRRLEPDMCIVYRLSPRTQIKQKIDWDVHVAMLKGDEIVVETKDRVPMHTQISHNFAKSYLTLSKCHFCQEFLMTGIRCLTCGIEFHKNCANSVPKLCEPAIEHSNYYRHLLARSSGFSPPNSTLSTSESPTNTTRPIRPRARSADENSKKSKSNVANLADKNGNNSNNNAGGSSKVANSHIDYHNDRQVELSPSSTSGHQYHHPLSSHSNNHHHSFNSNGTYIPTLSTPNHLQPHFNPTLHITNLNNISSNHTSQQPTSPKEQPVSPSTQSQLLEEKWEIDGDEIIRGPRIGQGSFATVYRGYWHGPVALKELNVKDPSPAQLQDFKNEVVVLKKTRHENVLLFMGYVLKPELIIVTQWCKGRSLYKHLHVEDRREFTNREIKNIALGVAQGMEYLHAKNIIHRDLKSNNIFIHDEDDISKDSVKIGDFGLATFKTRWEGNQQVYNPTGSILWMAPEVIRARCGVNPFTFQSDVYSYGIVLYELLSRKLPYSDIKDKKALLFLIGLGDPKKIKLGLDEIGPDKPDGLKALMLNCTERNTEDRPLFTSIIKDLKKIQLSRITRSTSEPLRLNDLNGSYPIDGTWNY